MKSRLVVTPLITAVALLTACTNTPGPEPTETKLSEADAPLVYYTAEGQQEMRDRPVEVMPAAYADAYWEALWGPQDIPEPPTDGTGFQVIETFHYDWRENGCNGWAHNELSGGIEEEFADLNSRIATLHEEASKDPRLADIDRLWGDCMADAGFTVPEDPRYAEASFAELFHTMVDAYTPPRPSEEESADWSFDNWRAWEKDQPLVDISSPEFVAEAEKEIAQAVADWDCKDSINYDEERLKVKFAIEEEFIAQNKAELEALKSAREQADQR